MPDYDVVVIGAGLGGVTAAARTQNMGLKTLILENTNQVGGCCSSYEEKGYKFDSGASVVELNFVIDDLFQKIGRKTLDYIDFMPIDPIYGFVTEEGEKFSYPVSTEGTREVIAQFSQEDAVNWDRFVQVGSAAIDKAFGQVMAKPMMTISDAIKVAIQNPALMKYLSYMGLSFENVLTGFFKNEKVRASMSLQSYFLGLPPALCPGYVAFLAYSEHEGIFYPRGGMVGIPQGILNAFEEDGGEIRLNSRVTKVLRDGKRVAGVELEDGTQIRSKLVISDINAKTLYLDLVGRENMPGWAVKAIDSFEVSIPAPMVCLGLDTKPDLDCHHTFCYTTLEEMNNIWFRDYLNNKIPQGGFMLISWPSHADESMAPEGHASLNLVTFAPFNCADGDWDDIREQYLDFTLDMMEKKFGLELRDHITLAKVITPKDFANRFLHPNGAVYGLQNDLTCTAMFRPRMKSPIIDGLYLAGASVHLGGGVPTTIGSGVCVGDLIEKYER